MGGRGSSSGMSVWGRRYGSQYHSILTVGNIKFVEKNDRTSETLMETMTQGRVYVRVADGELKEIVYFDTEGKRNKQIDLSHMHDGVSPHTHHGYLHDENDSVKGYAKLTDKESAMVERVRNIWENRAGKG